MPAEWKKLVSKNLAVGFIYGVIKYVGELGFFQSLKEPDEANIALAFGVNNELNIYSLKSPTTNNGSLRLRDCWQYDPENQYSDLPDVIYDGDETWKNFENTRQEMIDKYNLAPISLEQILAWTEPKEEQNA